MLQFIDYISIKLLTISSRITLITECLKLKKANKSLPKNYIINIIKEPKRFCDFIAFLCFSNNKKIINLIDIGANVGNFSADFITFFPKCKEIFLFEPLNFLNDEIKKKINKIKNLKITIVNKALSNKKKKAIFFYDKHKTELASLNKYTNEYNSSFPEKFIPNEKLFLQLDKLDNFCKNFSKKNNFIIKIDTQGNELEVIQGGLRTIARSSVLLLECSFAKQYEKKEQTFSKCVNLLGKIDMHPIVFQPAHGSYKLSTYAIERNVIFVKKELLNKVYYKNY
jgi:FkbM family methyltransferase